MHNPHPRAQHNRSGLTGPETHRRAFALLVVAIALACCASLLSAGGARAQQPTPSVSINQVDASGYPGIRAVVTVLDANGVPVSGLTAAQFQASDGPAPVPIAGLQTAEDPTLRLDVVLAIDVSGSMAGNPLSRAKQAATAFVNSLGPGDQAALFSFASDVRPLSGFSNDRARLADGINSLQAGGSTVLYDAVQTAAYVGRSATAPRKAIVLLTDGQNDSPTSQGTADSSIAAAKGGGVPVFTIGFGPDPDVAYLQALSGATQGRYFSATTGNVADVYRQIAQQLRAQYVLTLNASAPADGKNGDLRIVANVAGVPGGASATFVRGTAPAPPPALATPAPRAEPAAAKTKSGNSRISLILYASVIALVAAGGAFFFSRWRKRQELLRAQLEVVASNPAQAAAQPLPRQPAFAPPSNSKTTQGTGRLIERTPGGQGQIYELGDGPVVIGSSLKLCTIVLPPSDDVALEHARIWLRDGRYLLHHAGGIRRKTLVGGREADWVVLEHGDEVQVGPHRFVFEE